MSMDLLSGGNLTIFCITTAVVFITWKIYRQIQESFVLRKKWNEADKDVVVLHQFEPGIRCPNLSPFVLKVQCFLRLANIKYVTDYTQPIGPKGKAPWITINGEDISDSQLIVQNLSKYFNVDLDAHLSPDRRAALEAARCMVEHHLFWIVVLDRICENKCEQVMLCHKFPPFIKMYLKYLYPFIVSKRCNNQGIAAHSVEDRNEMAIRVFDSLDALLGERKFFGEDKPCYTDCTAFGFVAQIIWNDVGTDKQKQFKLKYPRLVQHCINMKEEVYPDWDSLLCK